MHIRRPIDSALSDGMAHVIWSEQLQDQEFMDTYCVGFDEIHIPEGAGPLGDLISSQWSLRYSFGVQFIAS